MGEDGSKDRALLFKRDSGLQVGKPIGRHRQQLLLLAAAGKLMAKLAKSKGNHLLFSFLAVVVVSHSRASTQPHDTIRALLFLAVSSGEVFTPRRDDLMTMAT